MFERFNKKCVVGASLRCAVAAAILTGTASPSWADSCTRITPTYPTCPVCEPETISGVEYCVNSAGNTHMKCTADNVPGRCEDIYDNANIKRACTRYKKLQPEGWECIPDICSGGDLVGQSGAIIPQRCDPLPS